MPASFEAIGDGSYRVRGDLEFESVPAVWEESRRVLGHDGDVSIDLAGVTRVDSAGLALVLEWLALAEAGNRKLRLLNAPDKLRSLARLSDVEEFLEAGA